MAGGGKDGHVQLARFPCITGCAVQSTRAHAGGVGCVRFAKLAGRDKDAQCLITAGTSDAMMLQWHVVRGGASRRRRGNVGDLDNALQRLLKEVPAAPAVKRNVDFESETHWRNAMAAPLPGQEPGDVHPVVNKTLQQGLLQLEHVYGYSGQDNRGNIVGRDDGAFMYPAGVVTAIQVMAVRWRNLFRLRAPESFDGPGRNQVGCSKCTAHTRTRLRASRLRGCSRTSSCRCAIWPRTPPSLPSTTSGTRCRWETTSCRLPAWVLL